MGPKFFQTTMGSRFYNGQLPALIKALERIAISLEILTNQNKEETINGSDDASAKTQSCDQGV
jgi:hypothetical protein